MSRGEIVAITAAAFGLAHVYQGLRNVVLTGVVGAVLASLTLATATLLPAITIHVVIYLRISFLPAKVTSRRTQ
jgi:membrane protease YdiL (CAAX protease family)